VAASTIVVPLGDEDALHQAFAQYGDQIACVIMEPLPANNGLLVQTHAFLHAVRRVTQQHGALLIFDEVISGFRFGFGGYEKVCGVTPDITTLGKIIGGGLPVGAVVGPKRIIDLLAPVGPVYQAGTMAGNPVALSAGLATLQELNEHPPYEKMAGIVARLVRHVHGKKNMQVGHVGSIFWPYLDGSHDIPTRAEDISPTAIASFRERYASWLQAGVYLPPSAYEVGFVSAAHTEKDIDALAAVLLA
jgi:glutamate-1-semialdehyde 2,1-aminomutase